MSTLIKYICRCDYPDCTARRETLSRPSAGNFNASGWTFHQFTLVGETEPRVRMFCAPHSIELAKYLGTYTRVGGFNFDRLAAAMFPSVPVGKP